MSEIKHQRLPHCRARYTIVTPRPAAKVVAIVDNDNGHMSVTNDAEAVVAQLVALGVLRKYEGDRLIYQDTTGQWDELKLTPDCRFVDFVVMGASSIKGALLTMNINPFTGEEFSHG